MASYTQNKWCPECKKYIKTAVCKCGVKTQSGTWSVRFRTVENGFEIQKRLSGFDTKKGAEKAYIDFANDNPIQKTTIKSTDITLKELYDSYCVYAENILEQKESTMYDYKNNCEKHIISLFGNKKISKITKQNIIDWQSSLTQDKYSYNFKTKLRNYFSSLFRYASLINNSTYNPFTHVATFKNKDSKKEIDVWNEQDFLKFFSKIDTLLYQTFFAFLYLTGCRKSEAFALLWSDYDKNTKSIQISKSISRKVKDKSYIVTSPKNAPSNRTLLLPTNLINLLDELKLSNNGQDDEYIFWSNNSHTPLAEMTVTRALDNYAGLADVQRITPHAFRHSHASLLISKGEDIVKVSKRLGHKNIEMTLNTYSHMFKDDEEKTIEKININLVKK